MVRVGNDARTVVELRGLHKSFGDHEVLGGVDLDVASGECVVIFGRSGSGKSTLLRCINLLEEPTSGSVEVGGVVYEAGPSNRTVDNFIVKLRKKIERSPDKPEHILTVYGYGYKLAP